jgi:N-dimethylarginine dimethylaminohydrolase
MSEIAEAAALGGAGWSARTKSLRDEIGEIWGACGVECEWSRLKAVLMHRPGSEIETVLDANKALMIDVPNPLPARCQHDSLVAAYRNAGVTVFYVEPCSTPTPNQMFVADLFFMTPEGAVLARPASTVRAGEERFVAQKLAELCIPILRCVRGRGVFEGADALWVDSTTVILGTGLRTNVEGAVQVKSLLHEMGIKVIKVVLPKGVMHLMGTLRFVDRDIAVCWRTRIPQAAVKALRDHGHDVVYVPDEEEAIQGMALNFVTLAPKWILMPTGNPRTQSFYEDMGIKCTTVKVDELHKAAGGIGCLTGILERELAR